MTLHPSELRDASVREAYAKAYDPKRPSHPLDARDISRILRAALDAKKVTRRERRDLQKILNFAILSSKAESKLNEFCARRLRYARGNQRSAVANIIAHSDSVRYIDFEIDGIRYVPSDYAYIAKKVANDDIDVYLFNYQEDRDVQGKVFGLYNSLEDELYVADLQGERSAVQRRSTIIHEATHAIQDKKNTGLKVREAEAAAHIAQAIMLITVAGGSDRLLYSRLKQAGIRKAAFKVYNEGAKQRGRLSKAERDEAKEVIDASNFYGPKSKNKTAMDAEWYSFFETLAYELNL